MALSFLGDRSGWNLQYCYLICKSNVKHKTKLTKKERCGVIVNERWNILTNVGGIVAGPSWMEILKTEGVRPLCAQSERQKVTSSNLKICMKPALWPGFTGRMGKSWFAVWGGKNIIKDITHPGRHLFQLLPSGRRYRSIRTRTNRLKNSFFPKAVALLWRWGGACPCLCLIDSSWGCVLVSVFDWQ